MYYFNHAQNYGSLKFHNLMHVRDYFRNLIKRGHNQKIVDKGGAGYYGN